MIFVTGVLTLHLALIPTVAWLVRSQPLLTARNLPLISYAAGLYVFLVAGMPFRGQDLLPVLPEYVGIVFLAMIPLWIVLLLSPRFEALNRDSAGPNGPDPSNAGQAGRILLLAGWAFCGGMALVYFAEFGAPPILEVFEHQTSAALYALRQETTYTVKFNRFSVFFYGLPPVLVALAWTLYRQDRLSLPAALSSIVLAALLGVSFLHKTPIVFIFLVVAVVDFSHGFMSARRVFLYGLAGVALVLATYAVYMKGYPLRWLLEELLERLATPYLESTAFILDAIPRSWPFFRGTTLPNPRGILPIEPVNLSAFVMEQYEGRLGAKPVPSISEGYANFGWIGAMLFSGLIAAWLMFLRASYVWASRSPVAFAGWLVLSVSCYRLSAQGFFPSLNLRLLVAILILIGMGYAIADWSRAMSRRPSGRAGRTPGLSAP